VAGFGQREQVAQGRQKKSYVSPPRKGSGFNLYSWFMCDSQGACFFFHGGFLVDLRSCCLAASAHISELMCQACFCRCLSIAEIGRDQNFSRPPPKKRHTHTHL
jgi:hypothetical protein